MLANQQRISSLPVQEPPTFNGDFFEYPTFVRAFEAIIENKVSSDRDRLYFLNKYTVGKANDVVKGFVTLNTDDGYKEARKLLAQRFGDPFHVAQAYKSKLKEWPQILEGDGAGVQSLSDYLVSCREAMKTMDCLLELNSTETLIQISAKLPSYVGTKWCRHAHELKQKTKKTILFSDLVEFVKTEANLATDPAFSPDILKRERNKEKSQDKESKRQLYNRRVPYASTHYTSTSATREDEGVNVSQCPSCSKNHSLDDCQEFKDNSIEDRVKFVRNKSLCFGCYGNDRSSFKELYFETYM
ncbi:hypothetical protein QZH41_004702 [Actinostola sp. cb2023]|nr:hypothetical protein QZH41_004702 [Actinostola sp. cb2023]